MKEFVEYIIKRLVDVPEQVDVSESIVDGKTIISLRVDKSDMGKVIGRKGKTASALRTLISASGKKAKQDVQFLIIDEEKDHQQPS